MTHFDEQPTTHTTGRRMTTEEETMTDELTAEALGIPDAWEPFIDPPERRVIAWVKNKIGDAEAQRGKQRHLLEERDLLAAELGRVQEAFDRAKPVIDAARAWARWHRSVYVENQLQPEILLVAAVDAYDTAQKAPDVVSAPLISADEAVNPQSGETFSRGSLPPFANVGREADFLEGPAGAPESTLSHEPAEGDRRYEDAVQKAPEQ